MLRMEDATSEVLIPLPVVLLNIYISFILFASNVDNLAKVSGPKRCGRGALHRG